MVWWILRILAHFFPLILKQSFLWLIFLRLTVKICQFYAQQPNFLAVWRPTVSPTGTLNMYCFRKVDISSKNIKPWLVKHFQCFKLLLICSLTLSEFTEIWQLWYPLFKNLLKVKVYLISSWAKTLLVISWWYDTLWAVLTYRQENISSWYSLTHWSFCVVTCVDYIHCARPCS